MRAVHRKGESLVGVFDSGIGGLTVKGESLVGVFDSGIGGLTVLDACLKKAPKNIYLYYGDNARAPYGSRPEGEIASFVEEALTLFRSYGVRAAVLACNTASAVCLDKMRKKFDFPIVGMEPAVKQAALHCKDALVLATPRTAESERLRALIGRFPNCRFTVHPAPKLAGAIEAHFLSGAPIVLEEHLPRTACDGVVLGCTHYSYFSREIAFFYDAPVYDGAEGTAARLAELLILGRRDHRMTTVNLADSVDYFGKFSNKRVVFLGKSAKLNENLFRLNFCSGKNEKNF